MNEAAGHLLQDGELKVLHEGLAEWHAPSDFQSAVNALHRRSTSKVIFNNPRQKFLLDAWTLAEFAVRHEAVDQVKLAGPDDRWPDGYVRTAGATKNVEVTIALLPGRKMGAEYKTGTGTIEHDPVENWVARGDAIPGALEAAITRKIAKRYSSRAWLVVYVSLGEYGIRQQQTERAIAQIKLQHAGSFEGLFVLWKDKVY
jgi:hypothetical protein